MNKINLTNISSTDFVAGSITVTSIELSQDERTLFVMDDNSLWMFNRSKKGIYDWTHMPNMKFNFSFSSNFDVKTTYNQNGNRFFVFE